MGGGAVVAYEYFQKRKSFYFDLTERLQLQDQNLRRLNAHCRGRKPSFCFDAVSARMAWKSEFSFSDLSDLQKGCSEGDDRACRSVSLMNVVQNKTSSAWIQSAAVQPDTVHANQTWPRVRFLDDVLSYRGWVDLSYQALWLKDERSFDWVCGQSQEFPEALVCATYGAKETNLALSRVAWLIEQDNKIQPLVEHRSSPFLSFWQGYDLQRLDFDHAVRDIKKVGDVHPEELEVWDLLQSRPWKFMLTFNIFSAPSGIPSHEFLHGVYFSSEKYRDKISSIVKESYWKLLPLRFFVQSIYKTQSEFVLQNEMQAYAMQSMSLFGHDPDWMNAIAVFRAGLKEFINQENQWTEIFAGP